MPTSVRLRDPDDFRVPLEVTEHLLAERVRDLGVDPGVLDVSVAEMIRHVLDAAAGVEKMYGDGVAKGVNRAALDAGGQGVLVEEVLDLALPQRPLAPGEEVGAGIVPYPKVGPEELRRVPPEWLLAA